MGGYVDCDLVLISTSLKTGISVIALLLGRLGLSVEQAKKEYATLTTHVFQQPLPSGLFDSQLLETELKELVKRCVASNDGDTKILDNDLLCKT